MKMKTTGKKPSGGGKGKVKAGATKRSKGKSRKMGY